MGPTRSEPPQLHTPSPARGSAPSVRRHGPAPRGTAPVAHPSPCLAPIVSLPIAFLALFQPSLLLSTAAAEETPYTLNADRLEVRRAAGRDTVALEGHVVFISGGTLLLAERGTYVSAERRGRFEGRVEIFHGETLLLGPEAIVERDSERLEFPRGVVLVDAARLAVAEHGLFQLDEESGVLSGRVEVAEGTRTLAADTLLLASPDEGRAWGHVAIGDTEERIRVSGEEALLRAGGTRVTGRPILLRFDAAGEIESRVTADTLDLEDSGAAVAIGSARIERGITIAEAGRARIEADGAAATLEEAPRVTREGSALTGDRVRLRLEDREVREVIAEGNARLARDEIVTEEGRDTERAVDHVWGDSLRLEVEADTLRRTVVWGNTRSTTERRDLAGAVVERNEVAGDSLVLFSERGEAERVRVVGNARGVYFPRPSERAKPRRDETDGAPDAGEPADSAASADTATARGAAPAAAAAIDSSALVRYSGREIDFFEKDRRIVLTGEAKLGYQEMELTADIVNYDLRRAALVAEGTPVLRQGGEEVEGSRMGYNLDERMGVVYKGRTRYQTGFLEGAEVVRVDPTTLDVRRGTYTSCDLTPPHYHFAGHLMRVYLDDKSVARPVVLHIRGLPVMALPFYILPLTHDRRSGFLIPDIEFGVSDRRGRFVRNLGYYWATNEYMDVAFSGDFYQDQKWTAHLATNYALRYRLSGSVRGSFTRETIAGGGGRRWDIHATHNQELGERSSLTARADFVSDVSYRPDQGNSINDLNRDLQSDISFQKNWTGQALSLAVSRREALDRGEVTERFPTLRYTVTRFPILGRGEPGGAAPWYGTTYLGLSTSLVNFRDKRRSAATGADMTTKHFATEETFTLSNSMKLFGWLGLSPSAEYREALFAKDNQGERWQRRGVWSAGASANTNLYGTWRPNIGPVVGLRHIMTPSVSFRYTPDFNQYLDAGDTRDRFPTISGIGGTPRGARSLGLSVQHTFQTKLRAGDKERSIDDLLIVGQNISRNLKGGDRAWSNLGTSVRLRPAERYEMTLSTAHDVYEKVIRSVSLVSTVSLDERLFHGERVVEEAAPDTAARGPSVPASGVQAGYEYGASDFRGLPEGRRGGPWRLSLAHNYSKGGPGSKAEQKISAQLGMNLSRGWRLDYAPYYDLRDKEIISQSFTLVRDLHCWEARFTGDYFGGEWEYFFKINIRAHPDVGYKLGDQFGQRLGQSLF